MAGKYYSPEKRCQNIHENCQHVLGDDSLKFSKAISFTMRDCKTDMARQWGKNIEGNWWSLGKKRRENKGITKINAYWNSCGGTEKLLTTTATTTDRGEESEENEVKKNAETGQQKYME